MRKAFIVGHFGGPMSYTPSVVTAHLGGPENGCLSYDIRDPKMPLTDRFMMTGGHCAPTCYAMWMVLYQAMESQFKATGQVLFVGQLRYRKKMFWLEK